MSSKWSEVKLGDVLTERREEPSLDDLVSGKIKIVEKIGFNTGNIELRSDGETKTRMILIRPGDLVISGINAAKGAVAIYDKNNTEPIAATIHYEAYIPNPKRVSADFLWWMLRSRFFQELLLDYFPGGIKTELKAKRLLQITVPLPTLPEQKRIVNRIKEFTVQINEARSLRQQALNETEMLIKCTLNEITSTIQMSGEMRDILSVPPHNGWSAKCDNAVNGVAVLSLGAITGFRYKSTEFKKTSLVPAKNGHFWLKIGDLLITRSNTPELVGHTAIYDGTPFPCIYPDLMMRLEIQQGMANKKFVWYWLQSPLVRDYITHNAKGTSPTMKKISQGIVMSIPFPTSLSLSEQYKIVAALDALYTQVDTLKRMQAESMVELDALLLSILDKAFKREL